MNDPAKILGVAADAPFEQIHAAFRKMASQNHPDLGGDKKQFQKVNSAYQILLNQREREDKKAKLRAAAFAEQKRKDAVATAESALNAAKVRQGKPDTNHGQAPKPKRSEVRAAQAARAEKRTKEKKQSGKRKRPRANPAADSIEASSKKNKPKSTNFLTRALPLQSETSWFILVNALDIFLTHLILEFGGTEANPIAKFFIDTWGYAGMITFKLCLVAFVCIIAQVIAVRSIQSAGRLLFFGTILVGAVVVYSAFLFSKLIA